MPRIKSDEKGFTLIEVIVTLILVGITTALAGMWIVSVANGYVFAKMNANTVQKGQLAMTRLAKEFSAIQSVTDSDNTWITYTRIDDMSTTPPTTKTLTVSGATAGLLTLGGATLTDKVGESGFTLGYCTKSDLENNNATCLRNKWAPSGEPEPSIMIEIKLKLKGANDIESEFTKRVAPRNL